VVDEADGGTTAPPSGSRYRPLRACSSTRSKPGSVTGGNSESWFLRSALDCVLVPSNPNCVGPRPDPDDPTPDLPAPPDAQHPAGSLAFHRDAGGGGDHGPPDHRYAARPHGRQRNVERNLRGRIIDGGQDDLDAYSLGGYWTHFGPGESDAWKGNLGVKNDVAGRRLAKAG